MQESIDIPGSSRKREEFDFVEKFRHTLLDVFFQITLNNYICKITWKLKYNRKCYKIASFLAYFDEKINKDVMFINEFVTTNYSNWWNPLENVNSDLYNSSKLLPMDIYLENQKKLKWLWKYILYLSILIAKAKKKKHILILTFSYSVSFYIKALEIFKQEGVINFYDKKIVKNPLGGDDNIYIYVSI